MKKILIALTLFFTQANSKKIFLFDWHGVICNMSTKKALKSFYDMPEKSKFVKNLCKFVKKGLIEKEAKWRSIEYATNQDKSSETFAVINCHDLNPKMISIIKKIKEKGYLVGVFSNIGKDSLEWMAEKDSRIKELLEEFDFIWTSSEANGYARKSEERAFEDCLIKIKEKFGDEKIETILIDDSRSKLKIANKKGFIPYYFKNDKKFKNDLEFMAPKFNLD